jgi:CheY-like chemotaxis protein
MGTSENVMPPDPGLNGSKKHILVVNDTQEILDLFREILEEEGYQVSLYSSAFNDVHQIAELKPHLVIIDLMIGGESQGWQLLQKMKMARETADIPVVVCTAAVTLARDLEGHLRAKNVGLVLKPFDIDDLVKEVRQYADPASAPVSKTS